MPSRFRADSAARRKDHPPIQRELTVLFADLDGFTVLTDARGELVALSTANRLRELARDALNGEARLIKRVGDAVMIAAPESHDVLITALNLQSLLAAEPGFPQVAMGIHRGPAVIDDGDIIGSAVNVAAHLADAAGPNELLCTDTVVAAVEHIDDVVAIERTRDTLGGLHTLDVYELDRRASTDGAALDTRSVDQ